MKKGPEKGLFFHVSPEQRRLFNHFCIRVELIGAAEKPLSESFGIGGFVQLMAL